jgi:hypothetical protein
VKGACGYFDDYFRYQIDRQGYPAFERLDGALQAKRCFSDDCSTYHSLIFDPGQHRALSDKCQTYAVERTMPSCATTWPDWRAPRAASHAAFNRCGAR